MSEPKTTPSDWLPFANQDYKVFQKLKADPEDFLESAAFHAQQAAEKWMKALWVLNNLNPPKIHDITTLIRKLELFYPELASNEWKRQSTMLSTYDVDARYPNVLREQGPSFLKIEEAL